MVTWCRHEPLSHGSGDPLSCHWCVHASDRVLFPPEKVGRVCPLHLSPGRRGAAILHGVCSPEEQTDGLFAVYLHSPHHAGFLGKWLGGQERSQIFFGRWKQINGEGKGSFNVISICLAPSCNEALTTPSQLLKTVRVPWQVGRREVMRTG